MTANWLTLGVLAVSVIVVGSIVLVVPGAVAASPADAAPAPATTSSPAVIPASASASPANSTMANSASASGVAACDGVETDGNVVVATVPGSDESLTDEATLYANTTLDLRLCSSEGPVTPYGDAWSLAEDDGIEVVATSNDGVRVRLEPGFETVAFPDLVTNRQVDRGLVVAQPTALAVEPALTDADRLYVSSSERADTYREHERSFLAAMNETETTVETLNETTAGLTGGDATGLEESASTLEVLESLNASVEGGATEASSFRSFLFSVAVDSPTPAVAVDVMTAVEDREADSRGQARDALDAYVDALDERAGTLTATIRTNVLVGLLGGLVLGLVGGAALPYLGGKEMVGRKRINSAAAYSRYALWLPVGGGLLLLALTVLGLAVTDGLSLLGVIL